MSVSDSSVSSSSVKVPFWKHQDFWLISMVISVAVTAVIWILLFAGSISLLSKRTEADTAYMVLLWLLVPSLMAFATSFFKGVLFQTVVTWRDYFFFAGIVISLVFVIFCAMVPNPLVLLVPYITIVWGVICLGIWTNVVFR